ncbi:hypothetical protein ACOMHN_062196 [Nucella lapillus]
MVMHARKQPRANDGYTERKDAHLHQWLDRHQTMQQQQQRGNGGKYGDRSPAEGSHSKHSRTDSPGSQPSPRYHNKMAYLERHKDKRGSLHLAEEKVSQYLATGSIGEKAPHTYGDYDEHEPDIQSDGSHDGRHGHDMSSRKGESKEERDHRAEVRKSAVRVCGDWSEHISSSGKRYYYNCQTEVSQWEKPKDWNYSTKRPERPRDNRGNGKSTSTSANLGGERRHSTTTTDQAEGRTPAYAVDTAPYSSTSQRPAERQSVDMPCSSTRGSTPQDVGGGVSRRNPSTDSYSHNHKGGPVAQTSHSGYCPPSAAADLKRNNVHHADSPGGDEPARQRQRMDADTGQRSSQRREAIHTLQQLQKVLSFHIQKQQSKAGTSQSGPAASSTGTTSSQLQSELSSLEQDIMGEGHPNEGDSLEDSLPIAHSSALPGEERKGPYLDLHHHSNNNNIEHDGRESPASVMSPGTSCHSHSPTPSGGSSPATMPPIGASALSLAALKSQQSAGLSPALSNYYNEKLIGHVLGWPAEQFEKQAERFRHEGLVFGSIHCSHVSVELKRARSNVRTAEIQSTIYEQRLMMQQQQRAEIENLKPPTSLLPS